MKPAKSDNQVGHVAYVDTASKELATPSVASDATTSGVNIGKDYEEKGSTIGKKRRTRRFKNRIKSKRTPYCKNAGARERYKRVRQIYPQSEAPNNTTQFLMDYHQDLEKLDLSDVDKKLKARENSLTSVDSEVEDQFCSSPEEEQEFLNRDFKDTYSRIHEEDLISLPKNKLIEIIIKLEDRIDSLEKNIQCRSGAGPVQEDMNGNDASPELKRLLEENARLHDENEKLKQIAAQNVEPSCSSSSSTSCESSSESDTSDTNTEDGPSASSSPQHP